MPASGHNLRNSGKTDSSQDSDPRTSRGACLVTRASLQRSYDGAGAPEDDQEWEAACAFFYDHGQSLDWIVMGDPGGMICRGAARSARAAGLIDDPIFDAIEQSRRCYAAYAALCSLEDQIDRVEWERQEDEVMAADRAASDTMIKTIPTTKAGLVALLSYVIAEFERGNELLSDDEMLALLATTRTAIVSLPVQS
jgi:hypothetical protein